MGKINLLIDTDIFIDYFNTGRFSNILENTLFVIYYSVVTEKELFSKKGLRAPDKESFRVALKNHRRYTVVVPIAVIDS